MPLTIADRKHQMPYGAQREVASEQKCTEAYVSLVMSDDVRPRTEVARKKLRRVRVALARKLGRPVDDVFPPETPGRSDTPQLAQTA